jgi:short-subunit dehydrogenase
MKPMKELRQRVVVITGSANGLGKELAKTFYGQGCHLALVDTDQRGLERLKGELETGEGKITIHQADVSSEDQVRLTRQSIIEDHKRVDILVNNAGISISQYFENVLIADFKKLFDVNFWGTVYCCKYFLPDLNQQVESHLVNIVSCFASLGFPGKSGYGSSKSAITGFTNALRTELYGTLTNISLVIPPPMDTGIVWSGPHIDEIKQQREAAFVRKKGMSIDKAAEKIVRGVRKGKYRIVVGSMMFWTDVATRLFPTLVPDLVARNKKRVDFL